MSDNDLCKLGSDEPGYDSGSMSQLYVVWGLSLASFPEYTGSICADGEDAWGEATEEGRVWACECVCA